MKCTILQRGFYRAYIYDYKPDNEYKAKFTSQPNLEKDVQFDVGYVLRDGNFTPELDNVCEDLEILKMIVKIIIDLNVNC